MECPNLQCQSPLESKAPIGSVRCPMLPGFQHSMKECPIYGDNLKKARVGCNTTRYSSSPVGKLLWPRSGECGPLTLDIGSSLDLKQPKTTFGKISHALETPMNSETARLEETARLTGMKLKGSLNGVNWTRSQETCLFVIIPTSASARCR